MEVEEEHKVAVDWGKAGVEPRALRWVEECGKQSWEKRERVERERETRDHLQYLGVVAVEFVRVEENRRYYLLLEEILARVDLGCWCFCRDHHQHWQYLRGLEVWSKWNYRLKMVTPSSYLWQ